jgi:hypothetical protein
VPSVPSTGGEGASIVGPVARLSLLVAALFLVLPGSAHADEDFFEPVSLGMGGTGRVIPVGMSTLRLNASALGARAKYMVSISYGHTLREDGHQFSSGAADSRTSNAFLGTTYSFRIFTPVLIPEEDLNWFARSKEDEIYDKRTYHRWDIAGGYSFLERKLNIGGAIRIIQQEMALREDRTLFTADAGVTIVPIQFLLIAVSAQNLLPTRDVRYPTRLSAGLGLDFDSDPQQRFGVQGEFDVVFDFTTSETPTTDIHGGIAVKLMYFVALRAGFFSDRGFIDNHVTWGLGFVTERFRLNFGMAIEAGPVDRRLRDDQNADQQRITWNLGIDIAF